MKRISLFMPRKLIIIIFFLTCNILFFKCNAQSLSGTYYIVPEQCDRSKTVFTQKLIETDKPRQVDYWSFNDGILKRGWMRYTLVNGMFYCPWDQQESHRSFYKLESDTIYVWYKKKDMKKSAKSSYIVPVISYQPLILKYDAGRRIHGKD